MIIAEVKGLAELTAALKQIPNEIQQEDVLAKALRLGADVVRKQAEANLVANGSVDSGLLAHTMQILKLRGQVPGHVEVVLKPSAKLSMVVRKGRWGKDAVRSRPSLYARWIERGFLHKLEKGTEQIPAEPFFRPAVDAKGAEAGQVIADEVQKGVAAAARKVGL